MVADDAFKPVARMHSGETLMVYDEAPTLPFIERHASSANMTFNLAEGN